MIYSSCFTLLVSLISVGLCFDVPWITAQVPKPCTSPEQWEGRVTTYNQKLKGHLMANISYDSIYQRTRVLEYVKVDKTETYYNIITWYKSKISYFIDVKTAHCSLVRNEEIWRDYGVQPDAQSLGEKYLGSSAIPFANLLVTIWTGNETRPINQTATYVSTWTHDTCLPVFDITFEPYGSTDFRYFYDISIGIKDPDVFIPPPQCFSIDNSREILSDFQ